MRPIPYFQDAYSQVGETDIENNNCNILINAPN